MKVGRYAGVATRRASGIWSLREKEARETRRDSERETRVGLGMETRGTVCVYDDVQRFKLSHGVVV